MQKSMELTVEEEYRLTFIAISGAVNSTYSPQLRDTISKVFANPQRGVVVNLSGVTYMDSSGLATLVEGVQLAERSEGKFVLAGEIPEKVLHLFEITRLDGLFERYDSMQDAKEKIQIQTKTVKHPENSENPADAKMDIQQ